MESVNKIITDAWNVHKEIDSLSPQITVLQLNGKKNQAQANMIRVKRLYKKLFTLKQKLISLVNGSIAFIKYEIVEVDGPIVKEAILVNLPNDEIITLIKLYCDIKHLKFNRILEIKRIPTKLG